MQSLALVDLGVGPYVHERCSTRFPVYTRGNAGEVWPEVAYPLSISLTRAFDDPMNAAMVKTGLVTNAELAEGSGCAAGVFGGYMYLNLSLSRVLAVRSPGVSIAENDAIYLGSEASAPPHLPNKADRSVRASLNAVRYMINVLRTRSLVELQADQRMVAEWKRRVPRLLEADDQALLATIRSLIPVGMQLFSRHLEVTGKAGAAVQFLSTFCEKQLDDRALALSLLSSIGDVDSAAPSTALWKLGRSVAASPLLTSAFDQGLDGLSERLAECEPSDFTRDFETFLDDFGARGPNEWETASQTWGTEPRLALALIDRLRLAEEKQDPVARALGLTADRKAVTAETRARVSWPLRKQFDRALSAAMLFSAGRERSKTTVVELIHVSRLLSRELAGRAARRTDDGQWEDMWFCMADELDAYIADPAAFADTIATRRATRQALSDRVPPFVFEGEMPPVQSWPLRSHAGSESRLAVGESITGLAAVPGVAEGRACVVTDPFDPGDLGPGDVLIAPLTDPAWTPLFVAAEAVVVDVGGQMSHAVIVAREFGMPCVVAATDATTRIPHGARVRVDATAGTVTLLE